MWVKPLGCLVHFLLYFNFYHPLSLLSPFSLPKRWEEEEETLSLSLFPAGVHQRFSFILRSFVSAPSVIASSPHFRACVNLFVFICVLGGTRGGGRMEGKEGGGGWKYKKGGGAGGWCWCWRLGGWRYEDPPSAPIHEVILWRWGRVTR